jgi:hypothetical protein
VKFKLSHYPAAENLIFFVDLLFQLGCGVEVLANLPRALGFTDVFRSPALGADNYINVNKATEGPLEALAAFRVLALERMRELVEVAGHGDLPRLEDLIMLAQYVRYKSPRQFKSGHSD